MSAANGGMLMDLTAVKPTRQQALRLATKVLADNFGPKSFETLADSTYLAAPLGEMANLGFEDIDTKTIYFRSIRMSQVMTAAQRMQLHGIPLLALVLEARISNTDHWDSIHQEIEMVSWDLSSTGGMADGFSYYNYKESGERLRYKMSQPISLELLSDERFAQTNLEFFLRGFSETGMYTLVLQTARALALRPIHNFVKTYQKNARTKKAPPLLHFYQRATERYLAAARSPDIILQDLASMHGGDVSLAPDTIIFPEESRLYLRRLVFENRKYETQLSDFTRSRLIAEATETLQFGNQPTIIGPGGREFLAIAMPQFKRRSSDLYPQDAPLMHGLTFGHEFPFNLRNLPPEGTPFDPRVFGVAIPDVRANMHMHWVGYTLPGVVRRTGCGFMFDPKTGTYSSLMGQVLRKFNDMPNAHRHLQGLMSLDDLDTPTPEMRRSVEKFGYSPEKVPGFRTIPLFLIANEEMMANTPQMAWGGQQKPTFLLARYFGQLEEAMLRTSELFAFAARYLKQFPELAHADVIRNFAARFRGTAARPPPGYGANGLGKEIIGQSPIDIATAPSPSLLATSASPSSAAAPSQPSASSSSPPSSSSSSTGGMPTAAPFKSRGLNQLLSKLAQPSHARINEQSAALENLAKTTPDVEKVYEAMVEKAADFGTEVYKTEIYINQMLAKLAPYLQGKETLTSDKIAELVNYRSTPAELSKAKPGVEAAVFETLMQPAREYERHLSSAAVLGAVHSASDFMSVSTVDKPAWCSFTRWQKLESEYRAKRTTNEYKLVEIICATPVTLGNVAELLELGCPVIGGKLLRLSERVLANSALACRRGPATGINHISPILFDWSKKPMEFLVTLTVQRKHGIQFGDPQALIEHPNVFPAGFHGGFSAGLMTSLEEILEYFGTGRRPWEKVQSAVDADVVFVPTPESETKYEYPQCPFFLAPEDWVGLPSHYASVLLRLSSANVWLRHLVGDDGFQQRRLTENLNARVMQTGNFNPDIAPLVELGPRWYYSPREGYWDQDVNGTGQLGDMTWWADPYKLPLILNGDSADKPEYVPKFVTPEVQI